MNNFIKVVHFDPSNCNDKALDDFRTFVLAGGEVTSKGLENRIRSASWLVFLTVGSCLSGVAALKQPKQNYRKRISNKSGVSLTETEYPFELGWVFVLPSARGRGFSNDLVREALSAAGTAGVFASSRADNIPMHKTLGNFNFERAGRPYPSDRGSHELQLFVRYAALEVLRAVGGKEVPK